MTLVLSSSLTSSRRLLLSRAAIVADDTAEGHHAGDLFVARKATAAEGWFRRFATACSGPNIPLVETAAHVGRLAASSAFDHTAGGGKVEAAARVGDGNAAFFAGTPCNGSGRGDKITRRSFNTSNC